MSQNYFLYVVAAIVNLLSFSTGISITWITPVLQTVFQNPTASPFGHYLTASEFSWLAGLLPLGATLGPLAAGKIADKIGRKRTLLIVGLFNMSAMVITTFATTTSWFYLSRILAGIALGSSYTVVPMYLAEISENHNRGTLGCSMTIFVAAGSNFALVVGPYVSVRTYSLLCLCPLVLFVGSFLLLGPETPVFLGTTRNHKALAASLLKLRNKSSDDVHLEMTTILEATQSNSSSGSLKELWKDSSLRKTLLICLLVVILPQAAGIGPILSFMGAIFQDAGVSLNPEICVIIVGCFLVFAAVISSLTVDRIGRKILLLFSSTSAFLSLTCLGLYFCFRSYGVDVEMISWLPLASLVVYILTFNVGLGPVPWVVMSELFPSNFTSIAATLSTFSCFMTTFIVTTGFPSMWYAVGMQNCWFIFGGVALIGTGLIWVFLPETKGKSLGEIQQMLGRQQ